MEKKQVKIEPQKIQMVPVDELIPYVRNPKKHPEGQINKIANLIKEMGFKGAILVDKNKEIITGHGRLLAAQKLGIKEVPVIIDKTLSPEQVKALRIADNKVAEDAEWIDEFLKTEIMQLDLENYNLGLTGLDFDELELLLAVTGDEAGKEEGGEKERDNELKINPKSFAELAPTKKEMDQLNGKKIIIEFSGGKDSLAAALWVKNFFPENRFILLYCDLGSEFVTIQPFLYKTAELLEAELVTVRSEINIFEGFIKKKEWPHHTFPYCQTWLNTALDKFVKTNFRPERVVVMRGGVASQKKAAIKKKSSRFIKIAEMKDFTYFQPVYFIDRKTAQEILTENNIPVWPGYSYGLKRTACRICPGQRTEAFAAIRCNYPDVWEELLWLEQKLGPGCWHNAVTKIVKGKRKQIRRSTFAEAADKGQAKFEAGNYSLRLG